MHLWDRYRFIRSCRLKVVGPAVVVTLLLGGCEKKSDESHAMTGQEVAQVGSEPITASELQLEVRPANAQQPVSDNDKALALQRIAARKSLAQRAVAEGLDRQPAILLQIRRAREQILAEAAAAETARADEKKLSLETLNAFIAAHPYLFAKRQILQIHELLIPASDNVSAIVQDVKDDTKLEQVQAYLGVHKIASQQKDVELDTGALPDALVKALLSGNNIPVVKAPPLAIFMQVEQARPVPVTGANAETLARNTLTRQAYEAMLTAPGPGDPVVYADPYKKILAKPKITASTDK